jgi:hypothetical protein
VILARLQRCLALGIVPISPFLGCAESQADPDLHTLEAGVLKVCLYPGFAPFSSKNGQSEWVGWDITYLNAFAAAEGLRFQPVEVTNYDGIWNKPARGTCDIAASGISDIPDRRASSGAQVDWSQHYYSVLRALLVRLDDEHKPNTIDDLRNRTVIVTSNSTADHDIRNRLARAGITTTTILTTTNEEDAAHKVLDAGDSGEPFTYAGGLGSVQYLASQLGGLAVAWPHCNMLADGSEVNEPFSFVVRTDSSGVLDALNGFISNRVPPYEGRDETDPQCSPEPSG